MLLASQTKFSIYLDISLSDIPMHSKFRRRFDNCVQHKEYTMPNVMAPFWTAGPGIERKLSLAQLIQCFPKID